MGRPSWSPRDRSPHGTAHPTHRTPVAHPAGPVVAGAGPGAVEAGPVFTTSAVVASCFGFVLIGALQALYGPSIPALRDDFGLSPSAAGLGLSAHFAGGVAGVLLFDRRFGRTGNRRILAVAYLLMAAGAAGFALAPDWPLALLAALLAGIGFGGIDYGLNRLFATGFGRRSTAMLNILNAHFGVGAILGPALIGAVGAEHYPALFLAFALANLPLLLCLRASGTTRRSPRPPAPATARPSAPHCAPSWPSSSPSTSCTWASRRAWAAGNPPTWSPSATARVRPPPRPASTG
ncbi:MFS transporter [Streptomyces sp. B21-102]|uniref:MFS transporter n=1 Tax=Streptomyces sp. B21-102 TaxID=3039416 RepID=UPI003FA7EA3E